MSQLQREETRLKALLNIARPAGFSSKESSVISADVENKLQSNHCISMDDKVEPKTGREESTSSTSVAIAEKSRTLEDRSMQASPANWKDDNMTNSSTPSENTFSCPANSKTPKQPKKEISKLVEVEQSADNEKIGLVIRKRKKKGHETEVIEINSEI